MSGVRVPPPALRESPAQVGFFRSQGGAQEPTNARGGNIPSPEGAYHGTRTRLAKLPEQNEETVLVVGRQIRPAPPGLQRQVTDLAALIGRESIPVLPTLRVQPQDRGEDSAPRDFSHGSDRLQTHAGIGVVLATQRLERVTGMIPRLGRTERAREMYALLPRSRLLRPRFRALTSRFSALCGLHLACSRSLLSCL